MTWVKICGITNLEDALTAVDAGADALGFVFYEKSQRKIDPGTAREIVAAVPARIEKVGVFVDESPAKVADLAEKVGLTAVQLHADEQRRPERQVTNRKVFLSLPAGAVAWTWRKKGAAWGSFWPIPENLAAIFIDSGAVGGTGKKFNWEEAQAFVSLMSKQCSIVVAGGLTPGNVTEAIRILKPWGVDVSSGVEASPGKKDPGKVRAFVAAVRAGENTL
ncbi:MAG: phosphoribosylanthranilate isomerase [Acidobacteriia bacterium]|nr:phosphoribosylanthranilate isomerase [Terriglobia bacterium]